VFGEEVTMMGLL